MSRRALALRLALALLALAATARAEDRRESTVGLPARIEELVLPGGELEAVPADAASPLVLRITRVAPHGDAFRYDLEYSGLDPGEYDLARFLRRRDGSPTDDLAPLPVTIRSLLPAGQVRPRTPDAGPVPRFGGYRTLLVVGALLWAGGLVALLAAGRRRRAVARAPRVPTRTLADKLRPLVERGVAGELSRSERAELELGLVAYWRRRLGLEGRRPDEALSLLRAHAEAGPLLAELEAWLHRPPPHPAVDLARLLAPYRDLPADALERGE